MNNKRMTGISKGQKIYNEGVNGGLPFPEVLPESFPAHLASKRALESNDKPKPFQTLNF